MTIVSKVLCWLGFHSWVEDPGIEGVNWRPFCFFCGHRISSGEGKTNG